MMTINKVPMTPEGFQRLENDLRILKTVERPLVIQSIAAARAHGDLSENAEYHAAKEKQGYIEARIKDLETKVSLAEVIDPKTFSGSSTVKFGATVTLKALDVEKIATYQIVGEDEAQINEGKIGLSSPLARALISKSQGDVVEVSAPRGDKAYEILEIHYISNPNKNKDF